MMDDSLLREAFAKGILVGPQETEELFGKRFSLLAPKQQKASSRFQTLFSLSPCWIAVTFSNKGLLPWQGACTWIDQEGIHIQLPRAAAHKKKLWGLYCVEEILAHEEVHALRSHFEEPHFEEILAYSTSTSALRRFFGPLIQNGWEVYLLLGLLFMSFFFFFLSHLLLLFFLGGLLVRLFYRQRSFRRTHTHLKELFHSSHKAHALLLGLTDKEIVLFSQLSPSHILAYASQNKSSSLRWRQLYAVFFSS